MQIMHIAGGQVVAVLDASELIAADRAMIHYATGPGIDSGVAIRVMQKFSAAREEARRRAGQEEAGGSKP